MCFVKKSFFSNTCNESSNKNMNWNAEHHQRCAYGVVKISHRAILKLAIIRFVTWLRVYDVIPYFIQNKNNSHPTAHLYAFQNTANCTAKETTYTSNLHCRLSNGVAKVRICFRFGLVRVQHLFSNLHRILIISVW